MVESDNPESVAVLVIESPCLAGQYLLHVPGTGVFLGFAQIPTAWHCRTCDAVVYGPLMNTHCTAPEGPAAVRISTSQASPS